MCHFLFNFVLLIPVKVLIAVPKRLLLFFTLMRSLFAWGIAVIVKSHKFDAAITKNHASQII